MTDRNDLDPYWLPSVAPFAAASEPPDSPPNAPPKQPWEFPLPHQPLFPMLYPANAPLPPPRAPIFPPFATISPPIGRMPAWMDTVIPRDEGRGILGQLPRPPIGPMPVDATGSAPSMLQLPSVPPPWPMPLVPHSWGPNGPSPWSRPAAMGTEPVAPTGIDDDPFARAAQCTREAVQPPGGRQEGAAIRFMQRYIAHVAEQLLTLPQRATEAAVRFQQTGELDPGPGIETAMLTVGLPFTPKGALGSGARRPPSLPMDEASRMARADAMGFRRNVPLEYGAVPAGEKIRAAAIEANGRVFTGPTHIHALEEAERELGIPVYQMDLGHFPDGGFVTNTGRYVSRWEARDIARRASQAGRTGIWGAQLTSEDTAMSRVRPSSKVQTGATAPGLPGGEGVWGWAPLEGGASAPASPLSRKMPPPPPMDTPNPGIQAVGDRGTPVATLWHRTRRPTSIDARGAADHEIQASLKEAWDRGHDAVMLTNYTSPGGRRGNVLVVKDLAQLRDPAAKFSPQKRDSNDLLASIAALAGPGVIVHVMSETPQENDDAFLEAWRRGDAL